MFETFSPFFRYLREVKEASEHTIRNYSIDLRAFAAFLERKNLCALESIDRKTIRSFLAEISKRHANRKTVVRKLSTLRSFFRYAAQQKLLCKNPMEQIDSPKIDSKIPTYLTYPQVESFLALPDSSSIFGCRDRAIMELFYSSGLRVSELASLDIQDVDFENFSIKIWGKGKRQRLIPITKTAAKWILTYLHRPERSAIDQKALFLNKHGRRLTTRSIDRHFEKYLAQSGLEGHVTPHTIRHAIATHWLENGMDLKTIQLLLGHKTIAATTIYTRVSTKLKKKVYDKSHPRA